MIELVYNLAGYADDVARNGIPVVEERYPPFGLSTFGYILHTNSPLLKVVHYSTDNRCDESRWVLDSPPSTWEKDRKAWRPTVKWEKAEL